MSVKMMESGIIVAMIFSAVVTGFWVNSSYFQIAYPTKTHSIVVDSVLKSGIENAMLTTSACFFFIPFFQIISDTYGKSQES
jgi:hypothetical protein